MKLSVVIVNYNVRYFLEQCLLSVESALRGIDSEVFVVDNCSEDDSVEMIRSRFPWVRLIVNEANVGFSKANNKAIKEARGEYVLLLNPDTIVGESAFRDCIAFMDGAADAGMCGVRMLRIDGSFAPESRRGVPTPFTAFCKMSGLCSLFPRSKVFGRYYMQYLDENKVNEIDIVSGAFMFIRKSVLDDIGLLDETFFMYGEDVDLSYRSILGGYKNYYVPTTMMHYKGESTKKASIGYVNAFHRAMVIFFRKHFGHGNVAYEWMISMAICFKAVTAYMKNKMAVLSRTEGTKEKFLLVGAGENLRDMQDIAGRNGVSYDVFDDKNGNMPSGDIIKNYDYVVFDTDRYPFTSILEFFRHQSLKKKDSNIGTYISQSKAIMVLHGAMR